MAIFPASTNSKDSTPVDPRSFGKRNVLNTHSAFNIPSRPELDTGTIIRFGQAATAFAVGKLKGKSLFEGRGEEVEAQDGEKYKENWKKGGKEDYQVANSPYATVELPEHQNSRWFSGVKVIDSLTMSFPDFTTDKGVFYPGQTLNIQNVMMSITQKKNIVKTPIAGSDGRVKQYISLDDYDIELYGKIIGYDGGDGQGGGFVPGERPDVAIRNFVNFMEAPTAVDISCDILELANITEGVIDNFKLVQEVGRLDNQAFTFKLLSDKPFEIIIEDV